jgi:hypothetical protein
VFAVIVILLVSGVVKCDVMMAANSAFQVDRGGVLWRINCALDP